MEALLASRAKLKQLLGSVYSRCSKCQEMRAEQLLVLPCVHVVCKTCAANALLRATKAKELPQALQPTKYHDPRRFECPVCSWPIYQPVGTEEFTGFLTKLPLHADLEAVGDLPPSVLVVAPEATLRADGTTTKSLPRGYETRQGDYVFDSVIGEYGQDVHQGQMRKITGLAVDEYYCGMPLVIVSETKANYILSFRVSGRLMHARRVEPKIRDVCMGPVGTVVASVAEEDYALAKWDSCLYVGGCRHENIFRNIYGHSAQINSEPFGVARDRHGRFVVTMLAKDRVCRWDEGKVGDNIFWYGDGGEGRMRFSGPYYVAKMSCNLTVVSCTNGHKVKVVDETLEEQILEIGGVGCDLGYLCYPHGVCVDSNDNIYIADTGNFRVITFSRQGDFLGCPVSETWNYGPDVKPTNVAVMANGRLLVAMQGHRYCQVHVYRPRGRHVGAGEGEEGELCECQWSWSKCLTGCCCQSHGDYETLD
ncbi:uncharacterized protein LOC143284115 [Babylonia areolata]|uniref:uncharacterized protein LOC143284115 n=1 Tax=Babylonia areolata TaxID=304850 RepID=UPI003FD16C72